MMQKNLVKYRHNSVISVRNANNNSDQGSHNFCHVAPKSLILKLAALLSNKVEEDDVNISFFACGFFCLSNCRENTILQLLYLDLVSFKQQPYQGECVLNMHNVIKSLEILRTFL